MHPLQFGKDEASRVGSSGLVRGPSANWGRSLIFHRVFAQFMIST